MMLNIAKICLYNDFYDRKIIYTFILYDQDINGNTNSTITPLKLYLSYLDVFIYEKKFEDNNTM